jgi:hypothetical protein
MASSVRFLFFPSLLPPLVSDSSPFHSSISQEAHLRATRHQPRRCLWSRCQGPRRLGSLLGRVPPDPRQGSGPLEGFPQDRLHLRLHLRGRSIQLHRRPSRLKHLPTLRQRREDCRRDQAARGRRDVGAVGWKESHALLEGGCGNAEDPGRCQDLLDRAGERPVRFFAFVSPFSSTGRFVSSR